MAPLGVVSGVCLDQFIYFIIILVIRCKGATPPKMARKKRIFCASIALIIEMIRVNKRSKVVPVNEATVEDGWEILAAITLGLHDSLTPQPSPGPARTLATIELSTMPVPNSDATHVNVNVGFDVPPTRNLIGRVWSYLWGY